MLKGLLKRHKLFIYIWTYKYYCYYRIYIYIYIIYIYKHPAFKTNRDEQVGADQKFEAIIWSQKICHYFFAFTGRCMNALALSLTPSNEVNNLKFWLDIIFGWSWSFFPATKIYILTFNLIHSLISLMGSFHFPQWKIFFPIHW